MTRRGLLIFVAGSAMAAFSNCGKFGPHFAKVGAVGDAKIVAKTVVDEQHPSLFTADTFHTKYLIYIENLAFPDQTTAVEVPADIFSAVHVGETLRVRITGTDGSSEWSPK